jgi:hypothetical protein
MNTQTRSAGGHSTVTTYDNRIMTELAAPPLRRVIEAPFTRRAWREVGYALASFPLAIAAVAFVVPTMVNGVLWALSTTTVRKLGAAARALARARLGEVVPAPPPIAHIHRLKVATPHAVRLFEAARKEGGRARVWETKPGVTISKLSQERITNLAAEAGVTITALRPQSPLLDWMGSRIHDSAGWRTRGYFALKLPLAVTSLAVIAACWLGAVFCLTFPPGGRSAWAARSPGPRWRAGRARSPCCRWAWPCCSPPRGRRTA